MLILALEIVGTASSFGATYYGLHRAHVYRLRQHARPSLMSESEVHRLELSVGVTPEGLALETDGIIREIDDQLLELDGVDQSYKNEVITNRMGKKVVAAHSIPSHQLGEVNARLDRAEKKIKEAKLRSIMESKPPEECGTIGNWLQTWGLEEQPARPPMRIPISVADDMTGIVHQGLRKYREERDPFKHLINQFYECECCHKHMGVAIDPIVPNAEPTECPNCGARRIDQHWTPHPPPNRYGIR